MKALSWITRRYAFIVATTLAFLFAPPGVWAQNAVERTNPLPFVSPIFGENMVVLQRGKANTIWGWSEPVDKIQIEIAPAILNTILTT